MHGLHIVSPDPHASFHEARRTGRGGGALTRLTGAQGGLTLTRHRGVGATEAGGC